MPVVSWHPVQHSDWLVIEGKCGNSNRWLLCVVSVIVHCWVKLLGSSRWLYVATDEQTTVITGQLREIGTWAKPFYYRWALLFIYLVNLSKQFYLFNPTWEDALLLSPLRYVTWRAGYVTESVMNDLQLGRVSIVYIS